MIFDYGRIWREMKRCTWWLCQKHIHLDLGFIFFNILIVFFFSKKKIRKVIVFNHYWQILTTILPFFAILTLLEIQQVLTKISAFFAFFSGRVIIAKNGQIYLLIMVKFDEFSIFKKFKLIKISWTEVHAIKIATSI